MTQHESSAGRVTAETKAGERPEQQVQRHGGRSEHEQGVCGGTGGKAQGERGWGRGIHSEWEGEVWKKFSF